MAFFARKAVRARVPSSELDRVGRALVAGPAPQRRRAFGEASAPRARVASSDVGTSRGAGRRRGGGESRALLLGRPGRPLLSGDGGDLPAFLDGREDEVSALDFDDLDIGQRAQAQELLFGGGGVLFLLFGRPERLGALDDDQVAGGRLEFGGHFLEPVSRGHGGDAHDHAFEAVVADEVREELGLDDGVVGQFDHGQEAEAVERAEELEGREVDVGRGGEAAVGVLDERDGGDGGDVADVSAGQFLDGGYGRVRERRMMAMPRGRGERRWRGCSPWRSELGSRVRCSNSVADLLWDSDAGVENRGRPF